MLCLAWLGLTWQEERTDKQKWRESLHVRIVVSFPSSVCLLLRAYCTVNFWSHTEYGEYYCVQSNGTVIGYCSTEGNIATVSL